MKLICINLPRGCEVAGRLVAVEVITSDVCKKKYNDSGNTTKNVHRIIVGLVEDQKGVRIAGMSDL